MIYGINLSGASLLGYDKVDIISKKVSTIMPKLFASNHDNFLKS
jgi:hypothetical protein